MSILWFTKKKIMSILFTHKLQEMKKSSMGKYFDQVRFVFLISSILCLALLFLDFSSLRGGRSSMISILLTNFNSAKQAQKPESSNFPTNFSGESMSNFPKNPSHNFTDQNLTTDKPGSSDDKLKKNQTEIVVEATKVEESRVNPNPAPDPCLGRYIYMYNLPSRFNEDLLKNCHSLMKWMDMCAYIKNFGFGPKVTENRKQVLLKNSWYKTNQFTLEVIFHNRMKHYKCLTKNSSMASAMFVPYYPGLDVGQYLWDGCNVSVRDASPKALINWLRNQHQWRRMWGRDHFLIGGRIGWDFRRLTDNDDDWGTKLMLLPEAKNMSMLLIESGSIGDDFPIPYPTYFHPSKDSEVFKWQKRMMRVKRPHLFSFAGAPRPEQEGSIRSELIRQCNSSRRCKFLDCYNGGQDVCKDPVSVMKVFRSSDFCLQPPGDSFTRRSTFDSILAGCIPVFFHPASAFWQYLWHLPRNGSEYSVFIAEDDVQEKKILINDRLARIPKSKVLAMREEVIRLIPRIIYAHPKSKMKTIEDAFDIAVKEVLARVEAIRGQIVNVNYSSGAAFVSQNKTSS